MKKILCQLGLAGVLFSLANPSNAQTMASIADQTSPAPSADVMRPQNSGSSTLQYVNFGGSMNHLYLHSWDVFSSPATNGIAWRRTNATGGLLNQGSLIIPYANDIDVVLFDVGGNYYALAAFYYDDGLGTTGHYYSIYQFTGTGLVGLSTMNLLSSSPNFGRINVDANAPYGVAITWCEPGTGIYVKAAAFPTLTPGPAYLIPGTSSFQDPDICIIRNNTGLKLQTAFVDNSASVILEQQLDFFDIASGTFSIPPITESTVFSTPGMRFGPPRIDGPDVFGDEKWTMVYAEYSASGFVPTVTVNQNIYATVMNTAASPVPTDLLVHGATFVVGSFFQLNHPVIAYNDNADRIHVGWMTSESTTVIPGTNSFKYVAQIVSDPTSGPVSVPSTYMMISNTAGAPAPVLAFSGQNTRSAFNGLHTAFSQGTYSMMYKNKPWSSGTFKMAAEQTAVSPSVYPNPFVNNLSLVLPLKADYQISVTGIDGKEVYRTEGAFEAMQHISIGTEQFSPGIYFVKIIAPEQHIDFTQKLVK